MRITDTRVNCKTWFKQLRIGDVFEYLESFYIKVSLSGNEVNAVDLSNGQFDVIRVDAEVDVLDAELVVRKVEEDD